MFNDTLWLFNSLRTRPIEENDKHDDLQKMVIFQIATLNSQGVMENSVLSWGHDNPI